MKHNREPTRRFLMQKAKRENKGKTSLTLESNIKSIKTRRRKKIILVIMQNAGGSITDAQCQIEENAIKNANCPCLESGSR
jgi:hypothetical protein